jgi:MFS family permease
VSVKSGLCLMAGIMSAVGFGYNEKRAVYPLFDLGLMKIRLFTLPLIAAAILFACLFVLVFMMPFFLTYPSGFSASKTGVIMIVPFLFLLVISPVSGVLADRIGSRILCTTGMLLMCLSLFSLVFSTPDMGVPAIVWRIALAGIGTALFVSPNNTVIMGSVPIYQRGIASGAIATARNLGMVSGVALAGAVFSSFISLQGHGPNGYGPEMAPAFMAGFRHVMTAGACLAVIGVGVTFCRGREAEKGIDPAGS